MENKIRVYIADDHTLFRKAMVNLLQTFDGVSEVKDAENGKELVALVKELPPDVVIVDLQMPVMDGTQTCEFLIPRYPDLKVIILTMHDSEKYILHMMEMGVHAFLLKNTDPDELEKAIHAVIEKDFYHNDLVASVLRRSMRDRKLAQQRPVFRSQQLTDREIEIVKLVCQELSNKEIGERLGLSDRTVENHRSRIMEKLGLKSAVGLVRHAYETGLIE
ncbi:MAG: response regulator transcription factor [Bacteroidia bacterium]|nr:response regulator transcription factor [Bacteroidia bacterium]